jgi:two-component sensor histidine kinase
VVATLPKGGRLVAEFGVHSTTARQWSESEIALVRDAAERTWAAAERARAEEALRESEEKYRTLFETMGQGYCELELIRDEQGRPVDQLYLELNPAFERLFSIAAADAKGRKASEVFPFVDPFWHRSFDEVARSGTYKRFEHQHGPGDPWFEVFAYPGGGDRVIVLYDEITERKRAEIALRESERHATLLLAELQHRVRNTLAVVRSIARRTAENSTSVEGMVAHFQGRLDAFSRVQAALTRSVGARVNLASLIQDELVAHATREGDQVRIDGPDLTLDPKTAERLSLAIHELTTNAVKHGALMSDRGRVEIKWSRKKANGSAELLLSWRETGLKLDSRVPEREGFGMELLLRTLPYDLQANTKVELEPDGLRFELRMPLAPAASV